MSPRTIWARWSEAQNWWSAKSARCVSCIRGCRCFETGALPWLSYSAGVHLSFVPALCTVWCQHTKIIHIYWQLRWAGCKRNIVIACQSGLGAPFHQCHSRPTKNAGTPKVKRRVISRRSSWVTTDDQATSDLCAARVRCAYGPHWPMKHMHIIHFL